MSNDNVDLFLKLVKLKYYLVSMIDNYEEIPESLFYAEEFLDLRFPDDKEEIITLLKENGILSDREIVSDTHIHMKFKNIAERIPKGKSLESIFEQVGISSDEFESIEAFVSKYKNQREEGLKNIVDILLQLARLWVNHLEIENSVDDLLALHEEEVMRPEEDVIMDNADKRSESSLIKLTSLTNRYLELLSDYYFNYGGDIQLNTFLFDLDKFVKKVEGKYEQLLKNSK
jgi:hypothetical protein